MLDRPNPTDARCSNYFVRGLFGQPGALDLLFATRVLSGGRLDRALLRRIANGGLLVGGPSRIAPYHTSRDGA